MMKDKLRILNIGDLHLAHASTPTEFIVRNLDRELSDEVLESVDLLTVAGDVFDRLVGYNEPDIAIAEAWITRLLYRCAAFNVVIRVVEGTPYHDRGQSDFFIRQKEMSDIPVDVKYFNTLDIEYIASLGIHMLYVPDKYNDDTSETLTEVKLLLKDRNLEKVDFALMHGAFEYQLPYIVEEPTHDSKAYLELVRYLIFIGHVHISVEMDRITPSGSFDRLAHGEEGEKGFHIADVDLATGNYKRMFYPNKQAMVYKTIEAHGVDANELWDIVDELVKEYPIGSNFALKINKTDMIAKCIKEIEKTHRGYKWKFSIEKSKKDKTNEMRNALAEGAIYLPPLTPSSMREAVKQRLTSKGLSDVEIEKALLLLDKEI